MKKILAGSVLGVLLTQSVFAAELIGKVEITQSNDSYVVRTEDNKFVPISLPERYNYILKTTASSFLQKFTGEYYGNVFEAKEIPTTISGFESRRGALTKRGDEFFLENEKVVFKEGKVLNGHKFDEESKNSFVSKAVDVEGSYTQTENGKVFKITSIMPAYLFSAETEGFEPDRSLEKESLAKIEENPFRFIMSDLRFNKNAQAPKPYRYTIFQKENTEVNPGETALLITLSGRTGDHIGSAAGHFVAGRATVNEDLTLSGEMFNSYVPNKKEIFSSNTTLPYYYGQVVGGQNVHRPTYTLVIYGDNMADIAKSTRDMVDLDNPTLRTQEDSITPTFNCTTIAMGGLKSSGLLGVHDFTRQSILDVQNLGLLNPLYYTLNHDEGLGALSFALATDPERFIPRNAFQSYVVALSYPKFRKKHGIKRVDLIQLNQYPSSRPLGGYPYLGISRGLKVVKFLKNGRTFDQGIVDFLNSLGE